MLQPKQTNSEEKKYWVPALERADLILKALGDHPGEYKMSDLCRETGINKSSMFSLLRTMEELEWISKEPEERYAVGPGISGYGQQLPKGGYNLVELFFQKVDAGIAELGETFQLSVLEGTDIIYLAKQEGPSLVKIDSTPGMRFPAYATAMGKVMLAGLPEAELTDRLQGVLLQSLTPNTLTDWNKLSMELGQIRQQGYALDEEEVIQGICCVAAPVRNHEGQVIAAVSASMLRHVFQEKQQTAISEVTKLAARLNPKHPDFS